MKTLTVETVEKALANKTVDELFDISIKLEAQGNSELADKILEYACEKQAVESYNERTAPKPAPAPKRKRKPAPAPKPVPAPEPVDVPVQAVQPADFLHLGKRELLKMVKYLGIDAPKFYSRLELAKLLADAENGTIKPTKPAPKPTPAPKPAPAPKPQAQAEPKPAITGYQFQRNLIVSAYKHKPADKYVPKPVITGYRGLQAACKAAGIKASGCTKTLEDRLERHAANASLPEDFTKSSKSTKSKSKSKSAAPTEGLSYRQAQRFNSWCKANIAGYEPPCKNSGWVNVRLLMVGWLNSTHFKQVMAVKKNLGELAAHLEVDAKAVLELVQATATLA